MIATFHIIFWVLNEICDLIHENKHNNEQKETLVKSEEVIINTDAEAKLKFDPPVYLQRYSGVQELFINEKWGKDMVKVVDFGCAELSFFKYLKNLTSVEQILCVDIDDELLNTYSNRVYPLNVDFLCRRRKPLHVEVLQGSIASPDPKLSYTDAVICIEIVEHLYPDTLDALPHNIFYFIQPRVAVFTTPNADFNVAIPNFSGRRHYDHKFEWSRQCFEDWAKNITIRYPNYTVEFTGIGEGPKGTEHLGCCSQMAVFTKKDNSFIDHFHNITSNVALDNREDCKFCLLNSFKSCDIISHGICTYESYNNILVNTNDDNSCEHSEIFYKLIAETDYACEIDNRTWEEIICQEAEYKMHNFCIYSKRFFNEEKDRNEIPLYELINNTGREIISIAEMRSLLEKSGWTIESCNINGTEALCVIYVNQESVSDNLSNISEASDTNYQDQIDQFDQNDSESYFESWDIECERNTSDISWNMDPDSTNKTVRISPSEAKDDIVFQPTENHENASQCGSSNDEKVELLFDSGYQISTSSIELSPEDVSETKSADFSKNFTRKNDVSLPSGMKSDGNIFQVKKKSKSKLENPPNVQQRNEVVVEVPPVPVVPGDNPIQEQHEVVENGDLANNNRDNEGNNYQAADHQQLNDNAMLGQQNLDENLDEHNENHIQAADQENLNLNVVELPEGQDDDDAAESLEDASREVLFDASSERSFSDDSFLIQGEQLSLIASRYQSATLPSDDSFHTAREFPSWLLRLLHFHREESERFELNEDGHFYSQGDGLGIHPVPSQITTSSSSSSSGSNSNSTRHDASLDTTTTITTDARSEITSTETSFYDALETLDVVNQAVETQDLPLQPEMATAPETDENGAGASGTENQNQSLQKKIM